MNLYDTYLSQAAGLEKQGKVSKAEKLRDAAGRVPTHEYLESNTHKAQEEFTRDMYQASSTSGFTRNIINDVFDGEKFPGAFGAARDYIWVDYWTLRTRSMQLFRENPYCKGVIRRLLRNEINTGLNLEASPIADLIGLTEDEAQTWGDQQETSFKLWQNDPDICDWQRQFTHGELSNQARMTAIISGDVLKVWHINPRTGLPAIELIDGSSIQTPLDGKPRSGNRIVHGVELDSRDRQVAYHVITNEISSGKIQSKRIPVFGEKSGRRISKLIYGDSELKLDDVRGVPLLGVMLYMLKELDRYRDSEQRAATVNSMLPLFIKKTKATGPGTQPLGGGALREKTVAVDQPDGGTKNFNLMNMLPGTVMDELAEGEEPVSFQTNRPNVNYGKFEETIINLFCWVLDLPPEIGKLMFQSNFSASRQANNEFEVYLKYRFWKYGNEFYQPDYEEFLIQSVLSGQAQAEGFLEAWRTPSEWKQFNAWINAEWTGISRPSVDIKKDVEAHLKLFDGGFITGNAIAKKFAGMSLDTVQKKRARERATGEAIGGESEQTQTGDVENSEEGNQTAAGVRLFESRVDDIEERMEAVEDANLEIVG